MNHITLFSTEARTKLLAGINTLANAVKTTLGPSGRCVVINKNGSPHITKDGVTVAKFIELDDPVENMGAVMIKQAASKMANQAGDGTTTTTLLTQFILNETLKAVENGFNPTEIKKELDKACELIVKELDKQSTAITTLSQIREIAVISGNNDEFIGELIEDCKREVGKGLITIDDSKTAQTHFKVVEGYSFDKGYMSPIFINNEVKKTVEFINPYIFIMDTKIYNMKDILPILEISVKDKRPIVIICNDIEEESLNQLCINKMNNSIRIAVIQSPFDKDILEDMAIITNCKIVTNYFDSSYLGSCNKITIGKETTTIIAATIDGTQRLNDRLKLINSLIEESDSEVDILKYKERYAKLNDGIGIIYVGGSSELEIREKKDRIDDALRATQAATEEGILPGGGVALIRCIKVLNKLNGIGYDCVKKALEEPLRQILSNSGLKSDVIIERVKKGKNDYGYNAKNNKYEKLLTTGVIDPTKVTKNALINAISISGMILITEVVCI